MHTPPETLIQQTGVQPRPSTSV